MMWGKTKMYGSKPTSEIINKHKQIMLRCPVDLVIKFKPKIYVKIEILNPPGER